ncbi:MAG: hypothetical protein LBR61_01025 [Synergistaceae bacterium]|jgi:hypothetical protein|nr:hypothetical protein [Synergistaceae bacterium]
MWTKPDEEDLLPLFMQETMGLCKAVAVYFGIPLLTAAMLLHAQGRSLRFLLPWYGQVLRSIFTSQNLFYLLHVGPAMIMRFVSGKRFSGKTAVTVALCFDLLAILIVYPVRPIVQNPSLLKNIFLFAAIPPLLTAFCTLRINRLQISGGLVILVFLGLLCQKFF